MRKTKFVEFCWMSMPVPACKKIEGGVLGQQMITMSDMKTTLIKIELHTKKFAAYPEDLSAFCASHDVKLPGLDTIRGQAYALMSQPDIRGRQHLDRATADAFFAQIGMPTGDSIQAFNKTIGLKRVKGRGIYCLVYPYEAEMTDIVKRKGAIIGGDRDAAINSCKQWWRENLVEVPNAEWQVGHLDPTVADATEANLAYQPPIQGKYRDRFKWDPMFFKMWPTATELLPRMDEYYTEAEQKSLLAALKTKWE